MTGKKADDIGYHSRGWTIDWQGSSGNIPGENYFTRNRIDYHAQFKRRMAEGYDVAIVVIAEEPYAEMNGD